MAGRTGMPVELILHNGKKHLTKAEIAQRTEAEQALYTGEVFRELPEVKASPKAHKEFIRLKKLYKKISYVDALDQQIINRYCLCIARIDQLEERADIMYEKLETLENASGKDMVELYKAITGIEKQMTAAENMLLKYEDRLFLNPTARIRAIPKKPEKEKEKTGMAAFMAKRADRDG